MGKSTPNSKAGAGLVSLLSSSSLGRISVLLFSLSVPLSLVSAFPSIADNLESRCVLLKWENKGQSSLSSLSARPRRSWATNSAL